MRCFGRATCVSILTVGALLSAADTAGAWTRPKGEAQVIVTSGRRIAPMGGLTIGGKSYIEYSTTDFDRSSAALGGFLRKQVWQDGKGGVGSVQAGYAHPIEALLGSGFEYAYPDVVPEAHFAGLYGRGWGGDWSSAFVSSGVTYHWRGEGVPDDLRFELTGGYAPWRRFMGMLSLYGLEPLGSGTEQSLKIAPSLAYTMWPVLDRNEKKPKGKVRPSAVQIGVSYDVLNPDDGLGVMVSVWRAF